MKTSRILATAIVVSGTTALSQGTISLYADLSGAQAVPPNSSLQHGQALLWLEDNNSLYARVAVAFSLPVNSVALFQSTSPSELGTELFALSSAGWVPPLGGVGGEDDYSIQVTLTPSQRQDLLNGQWWVNVSTPTFPGGEMRGQVTAVPEPATWVLLGFGLLVYCISWKTRGFLVQK